MSKLDERREMPEPDPPDTDDDEDVNDEGWG
jgi:hypothetical protein